MAQFYKGLSESIKNAITIQKFPQTWTDLVAMVTRLDDNFRRKSQKNKGTYKPHNFQEKPKRYPDEMNWKINTAFRKRKEGFQKKA
jgi:hypothetical protein